MSTAPEAIHRFQNGLEQYIKPREQVNYIRRVLALHLGYSAHDGPIKQPLSLADNWHEVGSTADVKGIHREYIEALNANADARRQFDRLLQADDVEPKETLNLPTDRAALLEERIALLKLQKKRERLLAVQRHLDLLTQKPASASEFLNVDDILQGATALPSVPKEVVNSLVAEQSASQPDLSSRASQLEKNVLRAKLVLKQEEQLLRDARSRAKNKPDVVSNGARLEALNVTRNELINWIETELSNASTEEAEEETDGAPPENGKLEDDQATVTTQLAQIKDKYAKYLASRKTLLALLSQRHQATSAPALQPPIAVNTSTAATPAPINHLLTPYIGALLSVSRKQKAAIAQKSHVKSTLSKQSRDSCQTLGHLAEESQLLPTHPMKDSMRRRSGLWNELTTKSSEHPDLSNRIRPWVFAADSAKIATLESVAETVEGGQVALENSMKAIQDINRLLGQDEQQQDAAVGVGDATEDDVWLNAGSGKPANARKHSEKEKDTQKRDIWSTLHGNLGLIGQEDSV